MKTFQHRMVTMLTVLSFLFISSSVSALTITWLGGTGNWVDAANWDLGIVPSVADEAIIPSGTVNVNAGNFAVATNLRIEASGRLRVRVNGNLTLSGITDKSGLYNLGRVYIYGNLTVDNVSTTLISVSGIYTDRYFYVGSAGIINVSHIEGKGIQNFLAGYFYNRGTINIFDIDNLGFSNSDRLRNRGTIDIQASTAAGTTGMGNFDSFYNYSTGIINITGGVNQGFSNGSATAVLRNYGLIDITDAQGIGMVNSNNITNYDGATININNAGSNGLYNYDNFTNYGRIEIRESQVNGIWNQGSIGNKGNFYFLDNQNYGIFAYTGSSIDNSKSMYFSGNTYDLYNDADFHNTSNGYLTFQSRILNTANGDMTNDGFWISYFNGSHSLLGGSNFLNNGVIEDHYDAFISNVDNQQVIVRRITGPMQNGVVFIDPIEVVSLSNVTIGSWYDGIPTTTTAGTYDDVTNEFTPNINAIGINAIYITTHINVSGIGRNLKLNMDNPVSAIIQTDQNNLSFNGNGEEAETSFEIDDELNVFPNPSTGSINLKADFFQTQPTVIQVFNSLGQKVMSQNLAEGTFDVMLNFPSNCTDGIYRIHAMQNGKSINVQTVLLQR